MYTCYTPTCKAEVSGPYKVCTECADKLYPSTMKKSISYWQQRFIEHAQTAPTSVDSPDFRSPQTILLENVSKALL